MKGKHSGEDKRLLMLKACSTRHVSPKLNHVVCGVIASIRITQGEERAEEEAEKVTKLIKSEMSESEIIAEIQKKYPTEYVQALIMEEENRKKVEEDAEYLKNLRRSKKHKENEDEE